MAWSIERAMSGLVGRDVEIARIERFLEDLTGRPLVLLIEGEPGIGKTTLWNAGLALARQRGFQILTCRPVESEARLGFSALADLLEPVPEAAFAPLPPPQRRALDAALLRSDVASEPPDRRAVAVATLGVLRALMEAGPVLVAVDDVPWLDRASARTLEYVLRRLDAERVGLLAAARSEDAPKTVSTLEHSLPAGRLDRLAVGPLTLGAFASVLNASSATPLRRPTLVRLHEATGGNPFFGLVLAAALVARGGEPQPGEPLPVPDSLRALMRGRIGALSASAREVALVVAAAPRPTLRLVLAVVGDNARGREALSSAAEAGIIQIFDQEVRFAHPLLRSLVYTDATRTARRSAHRRLADATREPEERARHLALGTEGPDESVAVELDSAAHTAYRRGAPDAAAELADLALAFTPPDRTSARVRRLSEAGELHFAAFDPDRARKLLEEAIASSDPSPERASARHRLAKVLRYSQTGSAAAELLRHALEEAGEDAALRAAIHRDLGFVLLNVGDQSGIQHYRAALEIAERIGDRVLAAQMLGLAAFVEFVLGKGVRRDLIKRSLADAAWTEHIPMELQPKVVVSHILNWSDDLAGARRLLLEEYAGLTERGAETDLPILLVWMVEVELSAGDWDLAERYATQGYETALLSGAATPIALVRAFRSGLWGCRGRVEDARSDAHAAIEIGERTGWYVPMQYAIQALGFLELSLGNPAAAHAHLQPLTAMTQTIGLVEPAVARFLPDDVESLIRLDRQDEAERLLAPFESAAQRLDRYWAIATAGRCRALLSALRGQHAVAAAALNAAFGAHERLAMPFELGRTHLAAGEVHRRARRKLVARKHLERAREVFARLGAPLWTRKVDREIERLGLARTARRELTSAERRVIELAVAGRSNREIADELFMGLRTVEAHLSRGYSKLGVRRRTQLRPALEAANKRFAPPA